MSDPFPTVLLTGEYNRRTQPRGGVDMLIDCDTCAVRDIQCGDCVMTVLLGSGSGSVELDSAEQDALGALASGGLLPPLRRVPAVPLPDPRRRSAIA
jgi:hypothetical protein